MRYAIALILLFVASAHADDLEINVRDYGAIPDGRTDNRLAFSKAIRKAADFAVSHPNARATVRVPGGPSPYLVSRPIELDSPNVWIVGDGPQSCIINDQCGPAIVVGVRQWEAGRAGNDPVAVQLPEESRPSRVGVLDGSIDGKGVRLLGQSTVVFHGGPFDLGPPDGKQGFSNWSTPTLVIDLAIQRNADSGRWPEGKVEGVAMLGGYGGKPTFRIQKGGGRETIELLISDSGGNDGTVSVAVGSNPIKRVSIQVDLAARKAYAWVDRIRVAATATGPAFQAAGTGRLMPNAKDAMLLGVTPQTADGRPPVASPNAEIPDWTYWGFSVSAYAKYRPDPIGSVQTSTSGKVVNDAFAYGLGDGGKCVATLYGKETGILNSRYVDAFSGTNGFRVFYGYQIQRSQYLVWGGQAGNGIKGLQLVAPSKLMAPTVQLFALLSFTAEDCLIRGGTQAVGLVPCLATYPIRIRNCRLEGMDTCISTAWSMLDAIDCDFDRIGRTAINAWASDLNLIRAKLWFISPNTEHIVASRGGYYGGHTVIRDMVADFEEYPVLVSPFLVSQEQNLMTTFVVQDAYLAMASKGKPLVKASFAKGLNRPFSIDLSRIDTAGHDPSKILESNQPLTPTIDGKTP